MAVCGAATLATQALAVPIQFQFSFASPDTPARANGTITFESTLLPNPPPNSILTSDPSILELNVVVTGASAGNGTFGLADFSSIDFLSDLAMDYSRELVGQPTLQNPWGTTDACGAGDMAADPASAGGPHLKGPAPGLGGTGGDFNLFGVGPTTPSGEWYFSLYANAGTADCMILTSMRPTNVRQVPVLDA